jgi:hypothetical protein
MSGPKNETPKEAPAKEPQDQTEQPGPDAGTSQAGQATAAVSKTVGVVRERLVAGEQFALAAALSIVGLSYFVFSLLLDNSRIISSFAVLVAVLLILAIWVHRWGHYDFGKAYRIVIGALGVSLALMALMNLLAWARVGGSSGDVLELLGHVTYWAGGVAAFYGSWLVFRTRED